jgi:integral membrane protein (TIGR01906 family)
VKSPLVQTIASVAVVVATPIVVVAVAVLMFLNPIWVGFDQGRTNVTALTGYSQAEVTQVTGSILSDLVFGPPNFDVAVNGTTVLEERERSHMADVRTVLLRLGALAGVAALLLAVIALPSRGRRWFWRAAEVGAQVLVVGVVVLGAAFALFFDQAFELFHELFFPPGTYMFDSATSRLVQLFPDQFWSETSVAIAAAVLALGVATLLLARRMVNRADSSVVATAAGGASTAQAQS